jgi:hypothetical protein
MRLTLRTLLAYMDEILEPADQEELAKKIESSDFAHDLILRTKDTMRRLRLSAPQLVGSGIGLDPNSVAEYLDNVLPPDRVADLERICLESDVHLAEVASCHHVLTMVLGEPADVDPATRERLHAILAESQRRKQTRVEAAHLSPTPELAVDIVPPLPPKFAPSSFAAPTISASRHEVPDYLRASAWNRYRALLVGLAAILVIGIAYMLTSGLKGWKGGASQSGTIPAVASAERQGTVENILPKPNGPAVEDDRATTPPSSTPNKTQAVDAGAESPYSVSDSNATAKSSTPPPLLIPAMGTPAAAAPENGAPGFEAAKAAVSAPPAAGNNSGATASADDHPSPAPPAAAMPTPPTSAAAEPSSTAVAPLLPPQSAPSPATNSNGADMRLASNTPPVPATPAAGPASAPASTEAVPPANQPAIELGTYLDSQEILLRNDPQSGAWFRLPPRSSIRAKDRLVALPAFHPRITLASGIQLKLSGGTELLLSAADPSSIGTATSKNAIPAIDVIYGHVVFVNTASIDNPIGLSVGGTTGTIRLAPNATFAVEVLRSYVPGRDPRQSPSPIRARFFAPDGNILWSDVKGEQTIHAPGQCDIADGVVAPAVVATSFPEWIDGEPTEQRTEQMYGAPVVEQTLDSKRPVETQLLELFQTSRKREVKSLVARSSVYVGLFVPFVEALRDSDQRATWKTHIDTLRSAMALGPDAANKVWDTLKEQRGEPAAHDLYEMLCGYSPEQIGHSPERISAGAIPKLIDWLEKEDLDYRVLAVQDLGEITGKHLMPHPEASSTERAKGIRIWRERLKAGEIGPVAGQ